MASDSRCWDIAVSDRIRRDHRLLRPGAGRALSGFGQHLHFRSRSRSQRHSGLRTARFGLENVNKLFRVWVQMSTAHRYGDPPDIVVDEDAAFGYGLAPVVGGAWEEAFARAAPPQVRQVILRTSFVLGRTGGALPRLAKLARWGLGGKVGARPTGHQLDSRTGPDPSRGREGDNRT